jgi:hypothetical protein
MISIGSISYLVSSFSSPVSGATVYPVYITNPLSLFINSSTSNVNDSQYLRGDYPLLDADISDLDCNKITGATSDLCTITGGGGGGGANVSTTTCGANNHVSAINNNTGAVTCSADTAGTESDPLWSANYTSFNDSWSITFNDTYDKLISDNQTWNETYADLLYYSISNPFSYINDTTWQYNQTTPAIDWVTAQNYIKSYSESDPLWSANYTLFNNSWSTTYNSSYMTNTYNSTYDAKPSNTYNSTYEAKPSNVYNSSYEWFSNSTIFLNYNSSYMTNTYNSTYDAKPSNTYNSTYEAKPSNTYNSTYEAKPSNTYNATYNSYNTTTTALFVNSLNATTKITTQLFCFNPTCTSNITWNGTNSIWY